MAVIRVEKSNNYTVMSNYHLREKNMSLKAKGLLSLMLSLPDDWNYTTNGLVAICKENESAIKSALKELKQFGYLVVKKEPPNDKNGGRFSYVYIIKEKAIQESEKQEVENLPIEILPIENCPTNKYTNKSITKEQKTNYQDIIKQVIDYLNLKVGSKYKYSSKLTVKNIKARVNEGFIVDDFKRVIDIKCSHWLNDEKMRDYLTPATLFGNKFEIYLNQQPKAEKRSYNVY